MGEEKTSRGGGSSRTAETEGVRSVLSRGSHAPSATQAVCHWWMLGKAMILLVVAKLTRAGLISQANVNSYTVHTTNTTTRSQKEE